MSATASTQTAVPPFDPATLQRFLDGERAELRDQVRDLLSRPDFAPIIGLGREEYRAEVLRRLLVLAESGKTALAYPESCGGSDDVAGSVVAFETLAYGDLSLVVKLGVQVGLWGGAVRNLGTAEHHERYLRETGTCELLGCFAMTETGHGSNVQAIGTTATYDLATEEFIVRTPDEASRKEFIGNAARDGHIAAVFCQLVVGGESHGVHCLVVPLRDADGNVLDGVRIEDCGEKLGLNGVDNGIIYFDQVRVPRENLLDRYAQVSPEGLYSSAIENPNRRFFTMLGTLVGGRVAVSAGSISAAKLALTIAIRYASRRRQFGPPDGEEVTLLDYRTQQRRLLPALARTYALHFAQEGLIARQHEAFTTPDYEERLWRVLELQAAGIKATSTWSAMETIQACREACGGAGYMAVNRFAGLKADVDVFTTFEGDNTVLMQLVAKGLLTDFKEEFGDLNPIGLMGFVVSQVYETVAERVFARKIAQVVADFVPVGEDTADPFDREYQLALFRWREEHTVGGIARRLKRWVDKGADPFEVFISVQDHVVAAARTHIDRLLLEAFDAAVARCEDPGVKAALDRVCSLYALSTIEAASGWYQDHGRLTSVRSKAITSAVGQLCFELHGQATALVDAFGIPDAVVAAPIGQSGR